jgi:hypothetical protein
MTATVLTLWAPLSASAATYPHITAIDRKHQVVRLALGPEQSDKYTVTSKTQIFVNGRPRLFTALKRGMQASVSHKANSSVADLIDAHSRSHAHIFLY